MHCYVTNAVLCSLFLLLLPYNSQYHCADHSAVVSLQNEITSSVCPQQAFSISPCGVFCFPWHRHQKEGTNGFHCLLRKTQTKWGERSCPSFETAEVVFKSGPLEQKSEDLPFEHHHHRALLYNALYES